MDDGLLMMEERWRRSNHQLSIIHHRWHGHTLVEVVTVVLVISILACIAVPRLNFGAVWGARADAMAERLATDLRHTRALAIAHAAENPAGFALVMSDSEPCHGYRIINRRSQAIVATCDIPAGVRCTGGRRFEFGPLGNLQTGSDTDVQIRTEGKIYRLEVVPATGAVTWQRYSEQE
jgi:prepilin-type N-terminal cleavage/methylation domain-containing protein